MNVSVNSSDVRCYVVNVTIDKDDISYEGEIELYSYGGGFEESDMVITLLQDDGGNDLDEDDIDRTELYQACINSI
tara:strand:+ start:4800 stop:5027 length:228 start_codon:yes stop_codon:yes gene_type:complete